MNRLPAHRAALAGRTWDRGWNPADYAAVEWHRRSSRYDTAAGIVVAVAIGIFMAAALWHWAAQ